MADNAKGAVYPFFNYTYTCVCVEKKGVNYDSLGFFEYLPL